MSAAPLLSHERLRVQARQGAAIKIFWGGAKRRDDSEGTRRQYRAMGTTPRVIALRSRCPPDSGGQFPASEMLREF